MHTRMPASVHNGFTTHACTCLRKCLYNRYYIRCFYTGLILFFKFLGVSLLGDQTLCLGFECFDNILPLQAVDLLLKLQITGQGLTGQRHVSDLFHNQTE